MIKLEQKLHPSKKKKKAATHSESVTESAPADFGLWIQDSPSQDPGLWLSRFQVLVSWRSSTLRPCHSCFCLSFALCVLSNIAGLITGWNVVRELVSQPPATNYFGSFGLNVKYQIICVC